MIEQENRSYNVRGEFPLTTGQEWDTQRHKDMVDVYQEFYKTVRDGRAMTDWVDWPKKYIVSEEYERLKETAVKIREANDAVVVIGIGGSYLTPKMVINAMYGEFYNEMVDFTQPKIYFAGCDLSPQRLSRIIQLLSNKEWSIIYISKSGGTMEPALAFRTLWNRLHAKYGDRANQRVYAVTDAKKGILKSMANEHNWESFVIPDGIGGRYSAFTACGLLPIAVAGIDTDKLLEGAIKACEDAEDNTESFAAQYCEWRYFNYSTMRNSVELYAMNTPDMAPFAEWSKQLFGESEGKDEVGLFPASVVFPTDLHSLGQFLQEGTKELICETFVIREFETDILIPVVELNDNLDKRANKKLSRAANAAMDGAYKAHTQGGNPCGIIRMGSSLKELAYVMQSFFVACAVYCDLLGVDPFNQPGVEEHKRRMKESAEWDK